eukprot:scpid108032/ scgid9678/ 
MGRWRRYTSSSSTNRNDSNSWRPENIKKLEYVSHTKLINLCKTRWVARIAVYESFAELLPAVTVVFEDIATGQGWNVESTRKANSLLAAIRKFPFIHAFVVIKHGLTFVKGFMTSLAPCQKQ